MITPPLITSGDKIGIVAPGRKVSLTDVGHAKEVFKKWGLEVISAAHLHSDQHSYLAAGDNERLDDLQRMIDDPTLKAIISARGGYGTTRIVDRLDFTSLFKDPKWIIGFSDTTALHLKLFKLGIKSIHGTMPILFSDNENVTSIESLRKCLIGESPVASATANSFNKCGKVTAQIMGGNLSLIVDSIGTASDPDTNGKILVLEEIDEYFYKLDRMMMQLKRAGKLDNLAGLIIGHMTNIKNSNLPFGETIEEIISGKVQHLKYPIGFDFPIGHENPNIAWIHGSVMTLNVTDVGAQLLPLH